MEGIFKKDNVYVYVDDKEERDGIQKEDMSALIISLESRYHKVFLYGGRVLLEYYLNGLSKFTLSVDGNPINELSYSERTGYSLYGRFEVGRIVAFLNQMENLGIDTFLENYKSQLQQFKGEMEEKLGKMEQEQSIQFDDNKKTSIDSIRKLIANLTCMIFCLLINMNAGLDNQTYTDTYNEIINLYF